MPAAGLELGMSATADPHLPAPAAPPPPDEAPPREGVAPGAAIPGIRARDRYRSGRRLAWGIVISLVVHLLTFLVAPRIRFWGTSPVDFDRSVVPVRRTLPEMQALRIRIVPDATTPESTTSPEEDPARERVPVPRTPPVRAPRQSATAPTPTGAEETRVDDVRARRSPAERMRPEYVVPRLWERPDPPPEPEKSDFDRVRERVYARIEALNDSLALEGEAARRATDWTFTDKDGKKWGISPGQIHLGGVSLPLPIILSPPPDKAREARDRAGKGAEIDRQADRARIRGTFDEQVRATRERRDRERTEAKRDTAKAGGKD